jgi:hypothetical protein
MRQIAEWLAKTGLERYPPGGVGAVAGRDLDVWVHYLTAVFFDIIAAGFRACF